MITYLSEEELLLIHFKLIERYGGSHGIRDLVRLKSVTAAPKQEVFGEEQYPDIFQKAAVYIRNIIGDHPFVDGNKRSGMMTAIIFLDKNHKTLKLEVGELEDYAVEIATEHLAVKDIAAWLKDHSA